MNVDIFIPARLDSKRLSKKHLRKINGVPIIEHLVNRLRRGTNARKIIVCTTKMKVDDELVNFLQNKKIEYFRGDEKNILNRFVEAAKKFDTDIIIDVEGDKLFVEPQLVEKIILEMKQNNLDFIIGSKSSVFDPNDHFIHGIIPAGIRVSCIKKVLSKAKTKNFETGYKEFFINNHHITKKIFNFDTNNLKIPKELRLAIDYPEDFEFASKLYQKLNKDFTYLDILNIINKNKKILKIIENVHETWSKNYKNEIKKNERGKKSV